jgi:hypothetical protein
MLTQEQLDMLEAALILAIDQHLADGGKLLAGAYRTNDNNKSLCPIGCLTLYQDIPHYEGAISDIIGAPFTHYDLTDFTDGFDGKSGTGVVWELGQKLRHKYQSILHFYKIERV